MSIVKEICNAVDPQLTALNIIKGLDVENIPRHSLDTVGTVEHTLLSLGIEIQGEIMDEIQRVRMEVREAYVDNDL